MCLPWALAILPLGPPSIDRAARLFNWTGASWISSADLALVLAANDWDPLANFRAGYDPWAAIGHMLVALFGMICIAAGVHGTLGIWSPRLRGRWGRRGKGPPLGPVTCAGRAMAAISFGLVILAGVLSYPAPPLYRKVNGLCMLAGFALLGVGHGLDMGASPNPRDHDGSRWGFALFFVGFSLMAGTVLLLSPD
jgi:hypothetical protein